MTYYDQRSYSEGYQRGRNEGYQAGYVAGQTTIQPLPPVPSGNSKEISRFWFGLGLLFAAVTFGLIPLAAPLFTAWQIGFGFFSGATTTVIGYYFSQRSK